MKKTTIGKFEVQTESLIIGAVTACGAVMIAVGIKNFIDAHKIKKIQELPVDDEMEFEEYKANKKKKLRRKRASKIRGGIANTAVGSLVTALGIVAFTPLKNYVINDDFSLKVEKAKKIEETIKNVNDTVKDLSEGLKKLI